MCGSPPSPSNKSTLLWQKLLVFSTEQLRFSFSKYASHSQLIYFITCNIFLKIYNGSFIYLLVLFIYLFIYLFAQESLVLVASAMEHSSTFLCWWTSHAVHLNVSFCHFELSATFICACLGLWRNYLLICPNYNSAYVSSLLFLSVTVFVPVPTPPVYKFTYTKIHSVSPY